MPKQIVVNPEMTRLPGQLSQPVIPVHAYARPFAAERAARGDAALREILRHMLVIREFEQMLAELKAKGQYAGIPYQYRGPAHLSIGQEAAAVGAALALSPDDHVFGSHRSHGEFIAKGFSAIARLDPADALAALSAHDGGALVGTARTALGGEGRALAENTLLLGFLAEIFMRANGFNGGMGGSMHAFFPPFGSYPNNAIVGASAGIATGAALRKRLAKSQSIAVAQSGDGSTGCGPVWEAMNFAAMAQFRTLWPDATPGGLPVLFLFTNNFYAMGGQTAGETMGWDRLSRIGAGINPQAMHAETVDGTDPLAVADAVARKRTLLLDGRGPALLDVECYRSTGHSTTDVNAYRSREEIAVWDRFDPIARFSATLAEAGVMAPESVASLGEAVRQTIAAVMRAAIDPDISPIVDINAQPTRIGGLMFEAEPEGPALAPEPLLDISASTRVKSDARKARFGLGEDGKPLSPMRAITLRDGLFEAILHQMTRDPSLIAYGEECRDWGGAFGVYRGLSELFAHDRLFNAPISEAAIVATAAGHALEGGRALVELMYADFIGRAGDEIFNQLAKWRAMSGGSLSLPVVLRCSVGSKYGAQHSQDWTALIAHIPGLKVFYPATPYDAKGLMAEALASNDPVIFFESQRLYDTVERFAPDGVPADYYRIAAGLPDIKRAGSDVTILTIGPSLYPALTAAESLSAEYGLEAEIIDARTLVPFDYAPVIASLEKTGRLLVVTEASERGSFAMTLAANLGRFAFSSLEAAPRVLGAPNWIVPGAEMEATYFPQAHDIVDAVRVDLFGERGHNRRGLRNWDDLALARAGL